MLIFKPKLLHFLWPTQVVLNKHTTETRAQMFYSWSIPRNLKQSHLRSHMQQTPPGVYDHFITNSQTQNLKQCSPLYIQRNSYITQKQQREQKAETRSKQRSAVTMSCTAADLSAVYFSHHCRPAASFRLSSTSSSVLKCNRFERKTWATEQSVLLVFYPITVQLSVSIYLKNENLIILLIQHEKQVSTSARRLQLTVQALVLAS